MKSYSTFVVLLFVSVIKRTDGQLANASLTSSTEAQINVSSTTESMTVTTSTSTTEPTTTTALTPSSSPPPPWMEPLQPLQSDGLFCACDLSLGRCDVNCCCDPECSPDDRLLFSDCWIPPIPYFRRQYCVLDDHGGLFSLMWNNTPSQLQPKQLQQNGGLFCIVTDNVPKRKLYQETAPLTDEEIVHQVFPIVARRWDQDDRNFIVAAGQDLRPPIYRKGSPLYTLDVNGVIGLLELPGSLNSASCNVAKSVTFLEPTVHRCWMSLPCDSAVRPELMLANLSVFRLPPARQSPGDKVVNSSGAEVSKLVVPVVVRICEQVDDCQSDVTSSANCSRVLNSVTLRIGFNGTQGIRYILADLLYEPNTAVRPSKVKFETIYQFLDADMAQGTNPTSFQASKSGNPGYLTGKPLVVAQFNATGGNGMYQSLQLFPDSSDRSRLILFGQDSFQVLKVDKSNLETVNMSDWCPSQWKPFVLKLFWGTDIGQYWKLGVFGNARLNESAHWIPLQIQFDELPCLSRSIRAELIVVYVRSGSYDQPQNKLLNVVLKITRTDQQAGTCAGKQHCSFLLTQSVVFMRADAPTSMILPQPPRWRVQLPRDFFYPFLLSSTSTIAFVSRSTFLFTLMPFVFNFVLH